MLGLSALHRKRVVLVMSGLGFLVALTLLRFLMSLDFDPKFFRDALIPFAFLILGAAYRGSLLASIHGHEYFYYFCCCFRVNDARCLWRHLPIRKVISPILVVLAQTVSGMKE